MENVNVDLDGRTGTWTINVTAPSINVDANLETDRTDQPFGLAIHRVFPEPSSSDDDSGSCDCGGGSGGGGGSDESVKRPAFD